MSVINLSKVDIFGDETGTTNTANCYVIREGGEYCFPLVYGNGIKDGKDNKESYTNSKPYESLFLDYIDYRGRLITNPYIKDKVEKVNVIWKSDGTEIENLGYKDNYIHFTITKNNLTKQGENALIGIYDEEGKVIWSWHIWFYMGDDLKIMPVRDKTKYKKIPKHLQHYIFSINLGWNGEIGTFYQWGRKDPFRGDIEGIFTKEDNLSICNSISNPDKFFTDYNFEKSVNLWDSRCDGFVNKNKQYPNHSRLSIKTIYDPCPPGFKVPGCDVFEELDELRSGRWKNYGRMFGNRIFFPASGYRFHTTGDLLNVSSHGCYWSSAPYSQATAYSLDFYSRNVSPINDDPRDNGFSVRPIKEN
jgi:hypothetical protein